MGSVSCTWVLAGHSVGLVSAGCKANGLAFGLHLANWDLRVPRMAYVNFYTAANHVESVSSFPLFEKTEGGGLTHSRWRLSCARRQCGLGLGGRGVVNECDLVSHLPFLAYTCMILHVEPSWLGVLILRYTKAPPI